MVTTGGKVCIFVGVIVMFAGLFITMNTLVGLFLILAGIVTIIQGAKMKPLEARAIRQDPVGNHYNTGLNSKRDLTSKGAV